MPADAPDFIDPLEDCPWYTRREIFARYGYTALPPSELSDTQLPGRLWELLYAAAARRFFVCSTNHLSDRQLYTLLWDEWLDRVTADIPLEAETNTTTIVSEHNAIGLMAEEIYMRFYMDEGDRDLWRSTDPDIVFPPHEDPPYDRDRHLPVPPIPPEALSGWVPGDPPEGDDADPDPLGLASVDKEIAAANPNSDSASSPSDAAFQAELEAMEPENWVPPAQTLAEQNIPLLPPAEITDETLVPILWELLHNLALRGFYVLHTDHLTDRELYAELWERGLRDPCHLPGRNPRGGWFHDFLGSWGEDDMQKWLRFYATDEERAKHAKEYPKDNIPPKEKPCCNRDWRLPKGPFHW
ncbi:MAG: hypothetical protein C5B50_30015 [Verrucomicrobia bacterium]|nr:MAG: hypothetical protein C5B50_30015 [Verrucomicrobiota bacterium]